LQRAGTVFVANAHRDDDQRFIVRAWIIDHSSPITSFASVVAPWPQKQFNRLGPSLPAAAGGDRGGRSLSFTRNKPGLQRSYLSKRG
jgi:hypothetical protein